MINIAVWHSDSNKRQIIVEHLKGCLKVNRIGFKLYTIQHFRKFSENFLNGKYNFDIFFIEASENMPIEGIVKKGQKYTEFVLMDTSEEMVKKYMKYKPVAWICTSDTDASRVNEIVQVCINYLREKKEKGSLYINTKMKNIRIPYSHITFLESRRHQIIVHNVLQKDIFAFTATLDEVEKSFPKELFIRCHQSYLVNFCHIHQLDYTNRQFVLYSGETVDISKRYYKQIKEIFMQQYLYLSAPDTNW